MIPPPRGTYYWNWVKGDTSDIGMLSEDHPYAQAHYIIAAPGVFENCNRKSPDNHWVCTRVPKHTGPHIAHVDATHVVSVWPGDAPEVLPPNTRGEFDEEET